MLVIEVVPQAFQGPQGPRVAGKGSGALRCALWKTDVKDLQEVLLLTGLQPVSVNFRIRPMHTLSVHRHQYRCKFYSTVRAGY